ncbi:MAG: hypothetical protein M3Z07_01490 [Candidatus Eremiobacteraeota bacterium]|nr:hypothetical protein [Candidatus Eremiobacteraeota bacterium]
MKSRTVAVLSFALAAITPSIASAADAPYAHMTWRSIGPAVSGGRVAAVAGTANDPKLYYVGSAGGGLWKTVNGGATWTPVFEKQDVAAIGAVSIDPTDENVVWVGTGETNPRNDVTYGDGVYKTTDGGKTWKNVGLTNTRHISRILIDPKNTRHVIVGALGDVFKDSTDRGVYVTEDGGASWNKTLYVGPQSGPSEMAMDSNNSSIVYAGMWQFRRQPWTFRSGGPDDGLYKSTDGGKSFTKLVGHGLPEGTTGRIAVAIAPSDSKRVYAIIEAKGGILWRSDDAGENWTVVSNDTLVDQRPFYFTHLNVDPKNADHVYAVSEMLAESKDGGHKFKEIAQNVHVDYHAMWIAPNDPDRMITGEDGGYALTLDGGKNWSFSRNIPIGQVYHVGLSTENPYWACAPLQDNNGFCGPSNSLDPGGIKDEHWLRVIGGDGMWAVPSPTNPNLIVTDLQDGRVTVFDKRTRQSRFIQPYFDFNRNDFQLFKRKYRFNWDSPIAFAPWNGHVLWYGGNVVFQSTDLGATWKVISPDLTRNIASHQIPAGGPLATDVSGAEYSDTILDIEGSAVRPGVMWVGTDDGLVQLSRDGGKHWSNVTMQGAPQFGRVETVAPSPFDAATAYAIVDGHRSGIYEPYIYVTHNYGTSWTKITQGLPMNQYVRTVRPDIHNRNLLFAGTENGMWISYDGGTKWTDFKLNLPSVSVRDIREQKQFDDLAIATHGRALWILDDIRALQDLPAAQSRGSMLFPIRPAYQYNLHSEDEGLYTRFSGQNPPQGAIIDFYQASAASAPPEIDILDSHGHIVRHIRAPHPKPGATATPAPSENEAPSRGEDRATTPNRAGINRVVWDFREDGVTQWLGAAKPEYRGPLTGVGVLPGTYAARMTIGGHAYTQGFEVKPDPRAPHSRSNALASYAFAKKYLRISGAINSVLNHLDAQKKSLTAARDALAKAPDSALSDRVTAALAAHDDIFSAFSADYHNDEDSIQRPGALREDVPRGGFGSAAAPSVAVLEYARRFDAEYALTLARYNAYVRNTLVPLSAALKSAGKPAIDGLVTVR